MHTGAYSDFKNKLLVQASELRSRIRSGVHTANTSGLAGSLLQGNVVILPSECPETFFYTVRATRLPAP